MNSISKIVIFFTGFLSLSVLGATNDELTIKAYNAIYDNALTSVKGECLEFNIDDTSNDYYLIPVRENHAKSECDGDENVSAKMFDIRINKSNARIYTNQGSASGSFRELGGEVSKCVEINSSAEKAQAIISKSESDYVVDDNRRVSFYSAPNHACKIKNTFIIKGDSVNVYAEYNGFSSVVYFKKNGEPVSGWVPSSSIKSTGTGIGSK